MYSVARSDHGKANRTRNVSETATWNSWCRDSNTNSGEEMDDDDFHSVQKTRRSKRRRVEAVSAKSCTSSDDDIDLEETKFMAHNGGRRRPKCFSRNAILARENRLRKKMYIENIEMELAALRKENSRMKTSLDGYSRDITMVRKENIYLRNVLANSKDIAQLVRNIKGVSGLSSLKSSMVKINNDKVVRPNPLTPKTVIKTEEEIVLEPSNPDQCMVDWNPHEDPAENLSLPVAKVGVPLSLSSTASDVDDLELLAQHKSTVFNSEESGFDESEDLGFGPNCFGDWLDGDELLTNIGVCLHVSKKKLSLEFCSSCNEKAFSNWNNESVS